MLPTPVRRLLLVPLIIVTGCALAVLAPPVALLSWAVNLIRRRPDDLAGEDSKVRWLNRRGPVRHYRLLRLMILGLTWMAGEAAALSVFLALWIASGFGGRLNTEPYQLRHYAVLRRFLDVLYRVALRELRLTVTVAGPPETDGPPETGDQPETGGQPGDRPLIVLSRHGGPGDSVLIIHYLLSECQRRPRVVMKATLQLDPTVDIVANRLPNVFLNRSSATGVNGTRMRTEQIRRLAAGMRGRSALLIFPEGGNWTPLRWNRAVERLRRRGRPDLAARAAAMPNLLPPHGSGALTAIAACPAADVVFLGHTGLDRLVSVGDIWRSLHTDLEIRGRWWFVPADRVPRTAGPEDQLNWLYDWWERLDAWITAQDPAAAEPGPAPAGA
ncbi:MAG TPA: 1-acyl-sn-glycerol-3-phosphate acyltransferase [Trebonia sp.]